MPANRLGHQLGGLQFDAGLSPPQAGQFARNAGPRTQGSVFWLFIKDTAQNQPHGGDALGKAGFGWGGGHGTEPPHPLSRPSTLLPPPGDQQLGSSPNSTV